MKGYNRDKVKGEIDKASQKDETPVLINLDKESGAISKFYLLTIEYFLK